MSDPINLQDLLDTTSLDYPEQPSLPEKKTFFGVLTGEMTASHSKNGHPYFHFGIKLTEPGKDVTATDLASITAAGFSLGDYTCGVDFYLIPQPRFVLEIFHRFLDSIGLDPNKGIREKLRLAKDGNPTPDTANVLRGIPVMCVTPAKGTNGRVYSNNMDMVAGRKQ